MSELRELYQTVILDHNKRPRNFRVPEGANRRAVGNNPLCGDQLTVHLTLDEEGVVKDVGFEGQGCAISKASASLMTEAVKGQPAERARELFRDFVSLVTSETADADRDALGKLAVFSGVREFPVRVKCATLCWHTLSSALEGGETVSTE